MLQQLRPEHHKCTAQGRYIHHQLTPIITLLQGQPEHGCATATATALRSTDGCVSFAVAATALAAAAAAATAVTARSDLLGTILVRWRVQGQVHAQVAPVTVGLPVGRVQVRDESDDAVPAVRWKGINSTQGLVSGASVLTRPPWILAILDSSWTQQTHSIHGWLISTHRAPLAR